MPPSNDKPKVIIIKKKGGGHGHHGGAWKVAYADFVTAMMALFIVLWLLATSTPQAKKDIARYFRENGIFKGGQTAMVPGPGGPKVVEPAFEPKKSGAPRDLSEGRGDAIDMAAKALEKTLDDVMAHDPELGELRKQVVISVTPEGLLIQLIDNDRHKELMFDLSSADLKPALVELLKALAAPLAKLDNPLYVGGHTDARPWPARSGRSNWDLSFLRADNARKVLESNGLGHRVKRVVAYGDSQPLNAKDPMAGENRRLSILALRTVTPPPEGSLPRPTSASLALTPPPKPDIMSQGPEAVEKPKVSLMSNGEAPRPEERPEIEAAKRAEAGADAEEAALAAVKQAGENTAAPSSLPTKGEVPRPEPKEPKH
jgi:chemotaxis protein MotB